MICFQSGTPSLEEADKRIGLHIRDSIRLKLRIKVFVRTLDSDVLITWIIFFYQFLSYNNICEVKVEFGISSSLQQEVHQHQRLFRIPRCSPFVSSFLLPCFHWVDSTSFEIMINLFRAWQNSKNFHVLITIFNNSAVSPKKIVS